MAGRFREASLPRISFDESIVDLPDWQDFDELMLDGV